MTYEQLVAETRKYFDNADASSINGHLAVQFNVTGEGEGAFYVEVADGRAMTEPYEYYDRDAIIYITGDTLLEILNGKHRQLFETDLEPLSLMALDSIFKAPSALPIFSEEYLFSESCSALN